MAHSSDVLQMLCPGVEWTITEDDYATLVWHDGKVLLTQAQFDAGFAQYDKWKAEQDAKAATDKAALLTRLGLTADEFKTLLGGN